MKDEALNPSGAKIVHVPIPQPSEAQRASTTTAVDDTANLTRNVNDTVAAVLDSLRVQYDVEKTGNKLADFASLGSDEFVREVNKRRPKKGPRLSPAGLQELHALYASEAPGILEKQAQILAHERSIAESVHAAFGLTAEDLALLRASQPPRMPPGW